MEKKLPIDQWQKIQKEIASKVTILPDDVSLLNDCPGSHEFCYHTSKLPASSSSFSSSSSSSYRPLLLEEKLIGGVDLSFPPGQSCSDHPDDDHTAVAVYVILRNYQVIYQDSLMFTIVQPYVSSFLGE
jgi:Endonuclease V.